MTDPDYADDDLNVTKLYHRFLLRNSDKRRWKKKLLRESQKSYGLRDDLYRAYLLQQHGLKVGKYTYGLREIFYSELAVERIGAFCSIAKNVIFAEYMHPLETVTTHPFFYCPTLRLPPQIAAVNIRNNAKIVVGHDVWFGAGAIILTGVTIGTGAVIGAGAVVTKDVPPYAIVAGVPAKILRYRFDPDTIEKLLASRWWTWPDAKIMKHATDFVDPALFLQRTAV